VHKISIVQRGFGALGYTMQLPLEDRYLLHALDLHHQLAVLLARPGGRGDRARRDLDRRPERPPCAPPTSRARWSPSSA
jgi:hypothetical protein